jgi:hypothetical protein
MRSLQDNLGLTLMDYRQLVTRGTELVRERCMAQREHYISQHKQLSTATADISDTLQRLDALKTKGLLSGEAHSAATTELAQKIEHNTTQCDWLQKQIQEAVLSTSIKKDAFRYILEVVGDGCRQFLFGHSVTDSTKRARHS